MAAEPILILDDEDTIRFVLQSVVSELGHEVVTAGTVGEALALVADRRFSGALLDLVLPDGNGIQVLEAIKDTAPDTEVIIMTSHASVETAVSAIHAGAYDYINKPFEIDVVAAVVNRALEKRSLQLRNQQLVGDLEQQNTELSLAVKRMASLNAAGMGMSAIRELPELLTFFLDLVVQELEVDRASVMLLHESGDLRIAASHGIDDQVVRETRVKVGEGIVGRVAQTGECVLVDDIMAERDYVEAPRPDLSNSFISAPLSMSVPIKSDMVLGAINITNRRSGVPFTQHDVDYLLGLGGQAAVAIERARHLSHLQGAVESLEAAREQQEVTNRRLHEANAELEETATLKNQFLANTSHELRTPLSGIVGFLDLVLDDMCRTRDEEHEFLGHARKCAQKLMGLINDVLSIANIEAGKLSIDGRAIDVRSLFEEVQRMTSAQASQKELSISFEVEAAEGQKVRGDLGKVKQVLLNLVGNSVKFTDRGSIKVRATENRELGHFMFEVVDEGIGISAEQQKILFEKFTQVDGSHTRAYGGTGLGLAISKCLVELMGGIIGIDSAGDNQGTRVYFSLPIWRPETEHDQEATVAAGPAGRIEGPIGGALVMVVEDDPVFRRYLVTLLTRQGYRVVEASHAETAWVLLRRLRPSVVLIDYALSASGAAELRSGRELALRIDGDPETQNTAMIFVTGFEAELEQQLSKDEFVRPPAHLRKPVEARELLRQIDVMLGERSKLPMRILLSEEDPTVVANVRQQLPEDQCHLEIASGSEECLNVLRAQPCGFDLLLLGLSTSEANGTDVLQEMKDDELARNLPVVVMTQDPEPTGGLAAVGDRVTEVIRKPALQASQDSLRKLVERYRARAVSHESSGQGADELPRPRAA